MLLSAAPPNNPQSLAPHGSPTNPQDKPTAPVCQRPGWVSVRLGWRMGWPWLECRWDREGVCSQPTEAPEAICYPASNPECASQCLSHTKRLWGVGGGDKGRPYWNLALQSGHLTWPTGGRSACLPSHLPQSAT